MNVVSLHVSGFRNLSDTVIEPQNGMNVFYGDNAHGKTNLLEAIWMMTGGKSFRGSKDHELVGFGKDSARVQTRFEAGRRTQTIDMTIDKRRKASLNGLPLATVKRLTGQFCAVIFSPDHLTLVKEGPEGRRRFTDAACCQLRPLFMPVLADYTRVLTQRNRLIKAMRSGEQAVDDVLIDTFDERLAESGAQVRQFRKDYIEALSPHVSTIYDGLSRGREQMLLQYDPKETDKDALYAALRASRTTDMKAGFTTVGPHRDDIDILIGGTSARLYASQGQQRSAVLSLKLAESTLLSQSYNEKPIILLDDVMSELDSSRQEYILNHIEGFQVFVTCCDPAAIEKLAGGSIYHIENGRVTATR